MVFSHNLGLLGEYPAWLDEKAWRRIVYVDKGIQPELWCIFSTTYILSVGLILTTTYVMVKNHTEYRVYGATFWLVVMIQAVGVFYLIETALGNRANTLILAHDTEHRTELNEEQWTEIVRLGKCYPYL